MLEIANPLSAAGGIPFFPLSRRTFTGGGPLSAAAKQQQACYSEHVSRLPAACGQASFLHSGPRRKDSVQ